MSRMTVEALFIRTNPRDDTSGRWVTEKGAMIALLDDYATAPFLVIAQSSLDQHNAHRIHRSEAPLNLDDVGNIQKIIVAGVDLPGAERDWVQIEVGKHIVLEKSRLRANSAPVIGQIFTLKPRSRGVVKIDDEVRATCGEAAQTKGY